MSASDLAGRSDGFRVPLNPSYEEPVAALYEQGKVKHVGAFPELEDEMCDFGLAGLSSGRSPDRVDALVWAASWLMKAQASGPRITRL